MEKAKRDHSPKRRFSVDSDSRGEITSLPSSLRTNRARAYRSGACLLKAPIAANAGGFYFALMSPLNVLPDGTLTENRLSNVILADKLWFPPIALRVSLIWRQDTPIGQACQLFLKSPDCSSTRVGGWWLLTHPILASSEMEVKTRPGTG
jgi:hypothetical protein